MIRLPPMQIGRLQDNPAFWVWLEETDATGAVTMLHYPTGIPGCHHDVIRTSKENWIAFKGSLA